MKKSKTVAIGLLALSIAACTSKKRQDLDEYKNNANYYVDNGHGYNHGGISPFWVFWAYHMGASGRPVSSPVYVHQSYGRNGTYHVSSMGSTSRLSASSASRASSAKASISRGGFGSSGSSAVS